MIIITNDSTTHHSSVNNEADLKASKDPLTRKLPTAVICSAISYFDIKDLVQFSLVNRAFKKLANINTLIHFQTVIPGHLRYPAILKSPQTEFEAKCRSAHTGGGRFHKVTPQILCFQENDSLLKIVQRQALSGQKRLLAQFPGCKKVLAVQGNQAYISIKETEDLAIIDLATCKEICRFNIQKTLNVEDSEEYRGLHACFPRDQNKFTTVSESGLIANWEIDNGKVACKKSIRIIPAGILNTLITLEISAGRIGNTLYISFPRLVSIRHPFSNEVRAYSLDGLSRIPVPMIQDQYSLHLNADRVFVQEAAPGTGFSICAYNAKKNGSLDPTPIWEKRSDQFIKIFSLNDRWMMMQHGHGEVSGTPHVEILDAGTGEVIKQFPAVTSTLKGDLFLTFDRTEENSCKVRFWHIPSRLWLPPLVVPGVLTIDDLEMRIDADNSLFVLVQKESGGKKSTHVLRYALPAPAKKA